MAFPCLHACNNLALLAIGHNAIVGLRCSLAPGQELRRTKRHILRERDPVSVCAKALDSSTEIGAIFKATALIAPMQNTEAASGADLRQAHEVELIGSVDINEHLHHAREQCEGGAVGGRGKGSLLLDEVTKGVLARWSACAVLARLKACMLAALHFEHSHFSAGLDQRFLRKRQRTLSTNGNSHTTHHKPQPQTTTHRPCRCDSGE